MSVLKGKVAVVTGASRGIGRGIALALAEQGATVYVTGRTSGSGTHALPGTVGDTVEACTVRAGASGGQAIGVVMDLRDDAQVAALFERVHREQGRLDILVNNAISIPPEMTLRCGFWEKPLSNLEILETGLRAAYLCAWHAAGLMVPRKSGLIVAMSGAAGVTYTYDVIFGTTKSGIDRMARDMAIELEPHGVASMSLWQGFTFTERARMNLEAVPGLAGELNSAAGSSVEFPGRVIAALAADETVMSKTGGTHIIAELAELYRITDIDGRSIPSSRAARGSPIWAPFDATQRG